MKTIHHASLTFGVCLLGATSLWGAAFDSGSNGSYGAIDLTTSTNLDVPPDGIFHCTTVRIPGGTALFLNRNALNTPVYLLAQSNVVIGGQIYVPGATSSGTSPGRGGPGGFDGGFGSFQGKPAGAGQGPGGGTPFSANPGGVYAYPTAANTNAYGNTLLIPLVGGSGGSGRPLSGGDGGGGGGGAVLIASSTRIPLNFFFG